MSDRVQGPRRRSIRRRLLVNLGILFLLGMLVLVVAAWGYGRRAANAAYDHLLQASALSMADAVTLQSGHWSVDLPYAALELLAMAPDDRVFYRVATADGQTLTGYADLPGRNKVSETPAFYEVNYSGEPVRVVSLGRWVADAEGHGWVQVQVAQTERARKALVADMIWRAVLGIGLLTLAALVLVWWVVDRALRPIAVLESDLRQRDPGDLKPVRGQLPKELEPLVDALNHFIARLSGTLDGLRGAIGEAAHQLRNPLAALHAEAQLALDDDDPQAQKESLIVVERNARLLTRLTNQMISDASVTHRSYLQRFDVVDLAELVRQAVSDTVPRSTPAWRITCRGLDAPAPLRGDALMLREAVKNLVDNALKYGHPPDAPLQVELRRREEDWELQIADRGTGIAAMDAELLFTRFQRGTGVSGSGAGLGLAIVRRVVHRHRGHIQLSNRSEGGLSVILRLPGGVS